jgi:hypothetical protein
MAAHHTIVQIDLMTIILLPDVSGSRQRSEKQKGFNPMLHSE